jgi:thiol-disulfide isomerase/thioredoxin
MKPQIQSPKSTWTITRIGLIGSALILVATIAYTFYQGNISDRSVVDSTPGAKPAGPLPDPLPENVMQANINLLDGQKTKLADYSGKVLVVDLWATWCGPCRQEIPHLVQIAKEYKSKGVEVLGLTNEDPESDTERVKQFSEVFKINYPIGWADAPMQIGLSRGRGAIPQTYIIGRDGKVLKHFVGFSLLSVPEMKATIEAAVEEM